MLIECNNCGAPLDIKGREEVVKCVYCGVQSRVRSARTVAQATPRDWRPPAEWRAPESVRAPAGQVFTYHNPWRKLTSLVSGLITVLVLGAVAAFFVLQRQGAELTRAWMQEPAAQSAVSGALAQAEAALRQMGQQVSRAAGSAAKAGAPSVDYFAQGGAEQAVASLKTALGTSKLVATQLVLYPGYAIFQARSPKNPKHFDRYVIRDGFVQEPSAIHNNSLGSDIERKLFDPDEVALSKLPALLEKTVKKLDYEAGKVSHVIVESNLPFSKDLVMRVYVSGPRDSGRIDYRADGSELRVFR